MGTRADPPVPAIPPGRDVDVTGGPSSRPEGAAPQDLGAGSPLVYAPASGTGLPAAGMADDRADGLSSQATGGETGDEGIARAQDEPLLAARPGDSPRPAARRAPLLALASRSDVTARVMSPCRRPPVNPRVSSPVRSRDVPMAGCDGDGATHARA